MNSSRIAETIIEYTFYVLIFLVPIIWLPFTSELFEFNKIILVYFGTSIVLTAWIFKSVSERAFTYKRTPLDIPILLFLAANIAATIFSIDQHVSIFGYYSRFNGGLLSTVSYIILYFALVTFFNREKLYRLLKILLFSAAFVAVYAILQHPNPLFRNADGSFRGIDAGYWNQNAQARAFSTLGHPNWLAAFMIMVIPIGFFFLVAARQIWERILISTSLIAYFLAFTFTYSRGGTVGFVAMAAVLIVGLIFTFRKEILSYFRKGQASRILNKIQPPKIGFYISLVIIGWLSVFYFFGNAFTSRGINLAAIRAEGETQLAAAGNETGRIRLIVWKGGVEIFKNSPIFGSGVETFAFSYNLFRPPEHNLTVEWDFLYNKAHNEFVNYLSTTGGLGIATYMILVITPAVLVTIYLNLKRSYLQKIFALSLLASLAGYHSQNFFGFAVVPIALLFFLVPAFFFIDSQSFKIASIPIRFLNLKFSTFTS
ncbi:O-antigen ligase family protein, partial [Patescibacteria group bacterium]|nr:O-antigen ligase family protein [Patescibacteria group bacterium]